MICDLGFLIIQKGTMSLCQIQLQKKEWMKQNTTFIGLKLNNNTDQDILQALEAKQKKTAIHKSRPQPRDG